MENHDIYISGSDRQYLIITLSIIGVAYIISMTTDCLSIVLELNGILAAVPLAYILPALCYLKLEEGSLLAAKKLPALGLLIAGIFAAISGLILIIINEHSGTSSCVHGKVMPYCINNSTLNSTISTTAISILTNIQTTILPINANFTTTTTTTTILPPRV